MASWTRRSVLVGALALPFSAKAQEWPAGLIKLIAPFPAGGTLDQVARLVQPHIQKSLGATIIVENRPGAAGSVGARVAAKSPPDGRTWLFVFDTHATNPVMQPDLGFDSDKDLDPVMLIGTAPNVIACHPSRPYQSLAEVVVASKAKAGGLSYATPGIASLAHLTMLALGKRSGAQWVHVSYKGAAPAVTDAIGGHVDLITAATTVLNAQIEAKKLRPLAQSGPTRHPTLPNVPTLVESGYPELDATPWWGMFAPAKTPQAIVARFHAAMASALKEDTVASRLRDMGLTTIASSPDEMRAFYARHVKTWIPVVREHRLNPQGG
jgi:tripartite-type tricarboxylate transporter receptor subunit TctC